MNPNECFFFQPTDYTSSATVCKWCGKEKYQHKSEQKQLIIDIMNDDAKDGLYENLTAMQQLIHWLDSDCTPMDCLMKAKELLKVERQQIIDAVDGFPIHARNLNGEDYYSEIFGGNK